MSNATELYKVTFSSSEILTVGEYLRDPNSIAKKYVDDPDAFLGVLGDDGLTNKQRIFNSFNTLDEQISPNTPSVSIPIKIGTIFYIEYTKINFSALDIDGIDIVSTDEPAFKAAALVALEADKGYVQTIQPVYGEETAGTLKEFYPDCTVWVWCRAISNQSDENGELNGQFFDLSPFIENITTSMGKNGGNFQITLPPLVCLLDSDNKWTIRKGTIDQYQNAGNTSVSGQGYVAHGSLLHIETDQENKNRDPDTILARNQFFFHNVITSNDLVFIRFETLKMEEVQRYQDKKNYYVNKNNIAGRIYDMIGLVDSNSQTINPESNDISTTIVGRDLSKLFIEDGTYFFALENSQGLLKFAGQSEKENSQINRIFASGAYSLIGLYQHTSIEYILKFIIQQLSNIKIVPNNLFTSYGDRVNKKEIVTTNSTSNTKSESSKYVKSIKEEPANGIWQIIKLVIDKTVTGRRLCDSSFSSAQGSLLNFIQSAIQNPLLEYYSDTYGDTYNLIVRQPPYTQKALISLIEGKVNSETGAVTQPPAIVDVYPEDVIRESLIMDDTQVYSWYNFVPKNLFFGDASNFAMSYLGAIFFEEYAQVWGSKAFNQSHPYIPYEPQNNSNRGVNFYEKQTAEDLKYVVESSQYLPFTRKGTLVLNGDRRLKIGNILRYKSTGEIFFIDAVQQSFSISENRIDRTTTVQVSRGMIEQLIYGVDYQNQSGVSKAVGYFNIINTDLNYKEKTTITEVRTPINPQPSNVTPQSSFVVTKLAQPDLVKGASYLELYNPSPANKDIFVRFINGITSKGYNVTLLPLSTNRTYIQQAALKSSNPLNASAGASTHEVYKAIDVTITNTQTGKSYSKNTSEADWRSTGVPALANSLGLQWGGSSNDGTFGGNYIDRVHFQLNNDSPINNTQTDPVQYTTKQVKTTSLDLSGIFSNFKVDKLNFNFFLKNLQFDPNYRVVKNRQILKTDNGAQVLDQVTVTSPSKKKK